MSVVSRKSQAKMSKLFGMQWECSVVKLMLFWFRFVSEYLWNGGQSRWNFFLESCCMISLHTTISCDFAPAQYEIFLDKKLHNFDESDEQDIVYRVFCFLTWYHCQKTQFVLKKVKIIFHHNDMLYINVTSFLVGRLDKQVWLKFRSSSRT